MSYDPNNIFAKILRGEAPAIRVYEDAQTLAFMDIMPEAEGHVLVVPKEAAETLLDLSEDSARAAIVTTRRVAIAVKQALEASAVRVAQFSGADAGQTVPHCHFHIVPHVPGAVRSSHATRMANPADLEVIAEKIRAALV
ncbi:histidine triad (HIT) family protein [Lampropedia hyalina DSM 16112]|jgi:histidine triad (HIT) family protein|uniref:Histidine triad (HIT) family protein n=1 Tax=Lampropedia hyalina DSM 16112 TaxID=1122156 RepID=A0A1M5BM80_9BURK|nr:HIT domain-containing protein [Lampropedia hyalina]SHF43624.1 histidine triad (HIT) family protein [Lampropedia hyalina DSM 16112]